MLVPLLLVAGWSAAEAAIFFVVADVPVSWIAVRRGPKAAALAALVAAAASVVGAVAAYWWAGHDPASQSALYAILPGIDPALAAEAADRFREGMHAVLAGSFGGIPFKLFAAEAGRSQEWLLLALAPILRLPRFLLVGVCVGLLSNLLARWLGERSRLLLLVICWVLFYAYYWTVATA